MCLRRSRYTACQMDCPLPPLRWKCAEVPYVEMALVWEKAVSLNVFHLPGSVRSGVRLGTAQGHCLLDGGDLSHVCQ